MNNSNISCEIECRSDFLTGMYLIARVADSELDQNALLTIQEDCPEFILPFNYKSVNGHTEFTYKIGTLCKLQYFYGEISHAEYIALWRGLLSPLLECRDWFMDPRSFVLSAEHLYYDKEKKTVAYIYIPSVTGCSGSKAFSEMAVEVSKSMKVSDPVLENKVLRSIVSDFKPGEFLKMLLEHIEHNERAGEAQEAPAGGMQLSVCDEGVSNILSMKTADTANEQAQTGTEQKQGKERDSFKLFGGKRRKTGAAKRNGFKNTMPVSSPIEAQLKSADSTDITQEIKLMSGGTGLRCIGRTQLPQAIEVEIAQGEVFTIGRFDASVGKKRSSFEFDAKTKAVSRRHAAIERTESVYKIIDLASSAGTFVNDRKLPPNSPTELEPGCRVSFGNLGADYVWEAG